MDEEIEVAPNYESGNVPAETLVEDTNEVEKTPVVETEEPQSEPEPVVESAPEVELYELPDGRKVDGATLSKEWKENFLPEFTRKSQELAKVKTEPIINNAPDNPLADPNYTPQSYEELAQQIEARTLSKLAANEQARIDGQKAIEDSVTSQLTEIKATDPTLNENALFLHATKYGFRDLKSAHQNMKDMADAIKKTQASTAANIAKRADPVSINPGGSSGAKPDPSQFENARAYLQSLK